MTDNESWVMTVTSIYQIMSSAHKDDCKGDLLATLTSGKQHRLRRYHDNIAYFRNGTK